jgi:hypothetical protein
VNVNIFSFNPTSCSIAIRKPKPTKGCRADDDDNDNDANDVQWPQDADRPMLSAHKGPILFFDSITASQLRHLSEHLYSQFFHILSHALFV